MSTEIPRFGQYLIQKGVVEKRTIMMAAILINHEKEESGKIRRLEEVLVDNFQLDHDVVFHNLAEFYAFRSIVLDVKAMESQQVKQMQELLNKIPESLKTELYNKHILPYQIKPGTKNTLVVLASNVTEKTIEKIPHSTEFKRYEVVYCAKNTIDELLNAMGPRKNEFLEILQEEMPATGEDFFVEDKEMNEAAIDDEINKSLLVNLFEGCLVEAVRRGASDIHIIPYSKSSVDIYFRIDGKLMLWHRQDNTSPEAMSAVVKDRTTGADRFERDTAQDGFAQRMIDGYLIRFRVSLMPITSSEFERRFESIVIRAIDDRNVVTDLKKLGFQEQAEKDFLKAINKTKGIVIVTGPTGSGKSTTLMAALYNTIDPTKNVLTVEDPVEFVIKGARQLKISHKLSFEDAIRSILRHDPDIVMVGEIRDKITAETAVKLANTGHLTFSTLHTNDAPSAVSRLYKMGVEPFILANVINIIVAQRLVRKLCPNCRIPLAKENHPIALEMGITQEEIDAGKIYDRGPGCKYCNNGYKGRVNITEALYFSPEVKKEIINSGNNIDEDRIREIAQAHGMLTLRESGVDRIRHGLSSLEEVIYNTSDD